MKPVLSKIAIVALVIASLALLYSAKSFAWKEYLMDPMNTDVFDEYSTATVPNGYGTHSIQMTYTGNSYWRQVAPNYKIKNDANLNLGVKPDTRGVEGPNGPGYFVLPFDNNSTATLTQAPPIDVPGFVNGSTITQTNINKENVITTGTSSGGSAPAGWSPTVVITGGSSSGTTGAAGSGGIIVIPSR